jgi:hypothetical protein
MWAFMTWADLGVRTDSRSPRPRDRFAAPRVSGGGYTLSLRLEQAELLAIQPLVAYVAILDDNAGHRHRRARLDYPCCDWRTTRVLESSSSERGGRPTTGR